MSTRAFGSATTSGPGFTAPAGRWSLLGITLTIDEDDEEPMIVDVEARYTHDPARLGAAEATAATHYVTTFLVEALVGPKGRRPVSHADALVGTHVERPLSLTCSFHVASYREAMLAVIRAINPHIQGDIALPRVPRHDVARVAEQLRLAYAFLDAWNVPADLRPPMVHLALAAPIRAALADWRHSRLLRTISAPPCNDAGAHQAMVG